MAAPVSTLHISGANRILYELSLTMREIRNAGQSVIVKRGEWAQYSSPHEGGAEYIAVCLRAFSPQMAHRDT